MQLKNLGEEDMNRKEIEDEITFFLKGMFGDRIIFSLIYGSFVYNGRNTSDIDYITIVDNFSEHEMTKLIRFTEELHKKYNLPIDNEVPYGNKLLMTKENFESAIRGEGFKFVNGQYHIPPIVKTPVFLSSIEMAKRLALNAITTPNIFLFGDREYYLKSKELAFRTIVKVVGSAKKLINVNLDDFIHILIGKGKEEGEMFLGYKDFPEVKSYLVSEITSALKTLSKKEFFYLNEGVIYFNHA